MAWFKADDKLHDTKKTRRALRSGDKRRDASAMGLWVLAGTWCAGNETDGFVPTDELDRWDDDAEVLAERLVDAGLWHPAEVDGEPGYQFHDWSDYQPTRAQLEDKREQARERMRRARGQVGHVRANGESTSGDVRSTPTRPDPTPKNTPAADAAESDPVAVAFDGWWAKYPRKTAKPAALKAFRKALRQAGDVQPLMAGLENAIAVWQAARTEPQFIPHPATWLNQGRWDDEHPTLGGTESVAPQVTLNQCDGSACPGSRHEWSDGRNRYLCQGA